ncbi:hypothetical protein M5E87_05360 [Flavonifractor plautii]|nr:hypothetical protein M5E87_05360 [Flavonifractor plautii]
MDFLAELSAEVLRSPDTRRQEASAAFGFWCRRARLEALAARHTSPLPRLGRAGLPSGPRQCARPVCLHPGHRPAGGERQRGAPVQ